MRATLVELSISIHQLKHKQMMIIVAVVMSGIMSIFLISIAELMLLSTIVR